MSYRGKGVKVIYVAKTEEPSKVSSHDTNVTKNDQQYNGNTKVKEHREEKKTDYKDSSSKLQNIISKDGAAQKQGNLNPVDPNCSKPKRAQDAKYEEESKNEKTQLASKEGMNSREHDSKKGAITDPFKKALIEVMKSVPIRFKKPTDQLYVKLKTRSKNDEQVLFMLLYELFDPYNLYELQCMIAMYCHLLLDNQHTVAHSYLNEFKFRLTPKLAQKLEYLPVFMDFVKSFPRKAQLLNFPEDKFFPEKEYLRITDLKYIRDQIHWVSFKDKPQCAKAFNVLKNSVFAIDGEWRSYGPPKLALLQMATCDHVFLFDMLSISEADPRTIDDFTSLFRDPITIKVFFGSYEDVNQICNFVNGISKKDVIPLFPKDVKSIVDLQISLSGIYDLPDRSLKSIAKFLFKKDLCKLNQCSNWNNRPLRESQLHYAALDAIVTFKIYEHVVQEEHDVRIYSGWKEIEELLDEIKEQKRLEREIRQKEKEEKRLAKLREEGMDPEALREYEKEKNTKIVYVEKEDSPI